MRIRPPPSVLRQSTSPSSRVAETNHMCWAWQRRLLPRAYRSTLSAVMTCRYQNFFDRTLLLLYYKLLGKKLVFTAHNVNIRKRDCTDTWLNRLSLRIQYQLSDHIFVHTNRMKEELASDFAVTADKVSVIPFGINNTVPN